RRALRRGGPGRGRLPRHRTGAGALLSAGSFLPSGPLAARIGPVVIARLGLGELERWSGETALRKSHGRDQGAEQEQVLGAHDDVRFQLFFRI
ncbi:hypothetical protein, partial [Bosea sp. (in: a-proteobacteria)]|uniref:hypothetical protein n=1 Tax=Bosea sp. (in: a-proteobacteria) TaxID=1871050 RepID=UPI002FC6E268